MEHELLSKKAPNSKNQKKYEIISRTHQKQISLINLTFFFLISRWTRDEEKKIAKVQVY